MVITVPARQNSIDGCLFKVKENAVSRFAILAFLSMLACTSMCAQGILEPHPYMERAVIVHHSGTATVKADSARPLQQAIAAVREEYGWVVDYEDPPYSGSRDVMDMTNPKYRATHPNAPVVLGPAGGTFQSTYPEPASIWSSAAAEQEVLEKIVSDYNESGNPGNFVVRQLSDGSFDVVGASVHSSTGADVSVAPTLDTPIYIASGPRSFSGTVRAILDSLAEKTGVQMGIGLMPMSLLISPAANMTLGGSAQPARDYVMQAIAGLKSCVWVFLYEPRFRQYLLSLLPAGRAQYDSFGSKRLIPIGLPAPVSTQ